MWPLRLSPGLTQGSDLIENHSSSHMKSRGEGVGWRHKANQCEEAAFSKLLHLVGISSALLPGAPHKPVAFQNKRAKFTWGN